MGCGLPHARCCQLFIHCLSTGPIVRNGFLPPWTLPLCHRLNSSACLLRPLSWVYGSYCHSFCPSGPAWPSGCLSLLAGALRMELSLPRTSCFHGWALSPSRDTQSPPGIGSVTSHSTRAASPAFREGKAAGGVPQHRTLPTVSHATLSCSSFSDLPPPGSPVSTVMPEFGALLRAPCVYPSGHRLCSWVLHCPSPVRLALSA